MGRYHGRGQPDEPHDELWFAALRSGSVRDAAVFDVLLRMYQKSAAFPFKEKRRFLHGNGLTE